MIEKNIKYNRGFINVFCVTYIDFWEMWYTVGKPRFKTRRNEDFLLRKQCKKPFLWEKRQWKKLYEYKVYKFPNRWWH